MTVRLMVVDDHALVREGVVALLRMRDDVTVVAEATDGDEAIELHRQFRPDVTLMDLRMPRVGGVEAINAIRAEKPDARFIVLTTYEGDEDVYRALEAGAQGYLLKGMRAEILLEAIHGVHAGQRHVPAEIAERAARRIGGPDFTQREFEVLKAIVKGLSNKEIAVQLDVTESTIKGHVNGILRKMGVTARTRAAVLAVQRGFVKLD